MLGFAKSSRNIFSNDPKQCENQYANVIEAWRRILALDKMDLCGHSYGGYISTLYAMNYPER